MRQSRAPKIEVDLKIGEHKVVLKFRMAYLMT